MSVIIDGTSGITSPTLDLTSGQLSVADGGTGTATGENLWRNKLINGAMNVWQRATTYALTTSIAYGSADRWTFYQATTANGVANQVTSGLTGFQYALKLGRNNAATTTGAIAMIQALETVNSIDMAGQTVTLSFYAKAGANFSATSSQIYTQAFSGTGTDQAASSLGGWTGTATLLSTNQTITTTWTRYSFTFSVGSTATQVGITIGFNPTGTAGADDNLYITGVQLEKGSTATSFEYRPYGTELALCQRYLPAFNWTSTIPLGNATSYSAAAAYAVIRFPVTTRVAPTGITTSAVATSFTYFANGAGQTPSAISFSATGQDYFELVLTGTFTAGQAGFLRTQASAGQLLFTGCEL
jgi:hypothetical protein